MAKDMCLKGTMDTSKYSAPVPIIGLYIAVGSLICFILILCDVWAGFRRKKFWFPCRFFSLNSITLTLIFSIASKIPGDLTTDMPSAHDQLAKLTGTVFICVTMGFMSPSVGATGEFESFANVTALTISVVTVFVNVCIQMATGVIYSFIVEHSIILFCMLLLIVQSWFSVVEINGDKAYFANQNSERLERGGEGNMLNRLKGCYTLGYLLSPQYAICKDPYLNTVPLVCLSCSVVLIEAMLKSLDLKFCGGVSDYDWSVLFILVSQILTILLVSLAIGSRWLTFGRAAIWADHDSVNFIRRIWRNLEGVSRICYLQFLHLFASINLCKPLEVSFKFVIYYTLFIIEWCLGSLNLALVIITKSAIKKLCTSQSLPGDYRQRDAVKAMKDMDQWMKKAEDDAPKCLIELLRKIPPTQEEMVSDARFSSLSVVLLVELAKLTTPASLHVSLINILGEVFESIHFIDENVNVNVGNRDRGRYAKIIWKYGIFHKVSIRGSCKNATTVQSQLQLYRAFNKIKERLEEMEMFDQALRIAASLLDQLDLDDEASPEEIYNCIQQVFVNRLHGILPQLPHAIFKYMVDSPFEELESRARFCIIQICRFKCLEEHMSLSFPDRSDFTSFYTVPVPPTDDTQTIPDAASRAEIQV